MTLVHMDGFEQYADLDSLAIHYGTFPAGMVAVSDDTPFGRGRSLQASSGTAYNGLIKSFPPVPYGGVVGQAAFVKMTAAPTGTNARLLFGAFDGAAMQFGLYVNPSGHLALIRSTGSPTVYQTAKALPLGQWAHVEFRLRVHNSEGSAEVRVNGETWALEENIDTHDVSGSRPFDAVRCLRAHNSNQTPGAFLLDSWVVWTGDGAHNNDWVGPVEVLTLFPDADVSVTGWAANAGTPYEAVDDASADGDATYIASATPTDLAVFGLGDLPFAPDRILGVGTYTVARADDIGPRAITHGVRSNGVDSESPETPLGLNYAGYTHIVERDPDGGGAWTPAAVDALNSLVKVAS